MNNERLAATMKLHLAIGFPNVPENDAFEDWFFQLAEMGPWVYAMGLQVLRGKEVNTQSLVEDLKDLIATFESIDKEMLNSDDWEIYLQCRENVRSIESMVNAILQFRK